MENFSVSRTGMWGNTGDLKFKETDLKLGVERTHKEHHSKAGSGVPPSDFSGGFLPLDSRRHWICTLGSNDLSLIF